MSSVLVFHKLLFFPSLKYLISSLAIQDHSEFLNSTPKIQRKRKAHGHDANDDGDEDKENSYNNSNKRSKSSSFQINKQKINDFVSSDGTLDRIKRMLGVKKKTEKCGTIEMDDMVYPINKERERDIVYAKLKLDLNFFKFWR